MEKAASWFGDLAEREPEPLDPCARVCEYDHDGALAWLLEAEVAFDAVFPLQHPLRERWNAILAAVGRDFESGPYSLSHPAIIDNARPVVRVARSLVQSGTLASLVEGIRAETVLEVLEQADALASSSYLVAATVTAGGALETHLRHVCDRNGLLPGMKGHGTIEKYRGLLDEARLAGNEIISKGDAKQLTAWADDRNLAAHTPTQFSKDSPAVQLMIEAIRQFIVRTISP